MTAPATIDVHAVAQAVLADRRKVHTVSTLQILAMCRALVDIAAQDDQAEAQALPITATLAVAIQKVIVQHHRWKRAEQANAEPGGHAAGDVGAALIDLDTALDTLKTVFEKEFPNAAV
jgi:hypothetical protein